MTGQIPDRVTVGGRTYWLAAVEGEGLFDAAAAGFDLTPPHTACWRGFLCGYQVVGDRLLLARLDVSTPQVPAGFAGVSPQRAEDKTFWEYRGLAEPVPFTGSLLLGETLARDLPYLHMGFTPAWHYVHVLDVTVDSGLVTGMVDRSEQAARLRERLVAEQEPRRQGEDLTRWIEDTFSLRRDYAWPEPPERD